MRGASRSVDRRDERGPRPRERVGGHTIVAEHHHEVVGLLFPALQLVDVAVLSRKQLDGHPVVGHGNGLREVLPEARHGHREPRPIALERHDRRGARSGAVGRREDETIAWETDRHHTVAIAVCGARPVGTAARFLEELKRLPHRFKRLVHVR